MLGTGNATVSQIYNTCFLLQTPGSLMLVDAGGGNGILAQLKKVNVQISDIHHLFVTHAHTDHVLGVIWVIRMVAQCKGYEGLLHVYGNDKVMKVIKTIIGMILAKKQLAKVAERVVFHQLEDGDCFEVVHNGEILVRQSEVDDKLRLIAIEESLQLLRPVLLGYC